MLKTQNAGYTSFPAALTGGVTTAQSASANTYGSYVQLTASTPAAVWLVGIHVYLQTSTNTPNYLDVAIGTGAAASESIVGTFRLPTSPGGGSTISTSFLAFFPFPIGVANGVRIASKTASDTASALGWRITLLYVLQTDLVDGVNEGCNVNQWLGTTVSTPTTAGVPNVNCKTWNDLATVALPLVPTTAGRTLDVSAGGEAGVDWANVGSPTTTLNLSGTTIATTQKVDIETIKTNPVVNAGTVTFPTTAILASTTNIAAGVITTVTTVTNQLTAAAIATGVWQDATNGDFNVANSIGKSIYTGVAPSAAGGLFIAGANAATTVDITGSITSVLTKTGYSLSTAGISAIWQDTTAGDFTTAGSIGKSIMNGVSLGTGLTVNDLTTKTGFSLLAGSFVTATFGTCDFTSTMKTSIGTAVWTTPATRTVSAATNITSDGGTISQTQLAHLDADVSSRMATYTQPIGFLAANFTTGLVMASTQAFSNTGTWTGNIVGTLSVLTTYTGNTPQTGDAFAYLGTNVGALGANLSAVPKTGFKLASDGLALVTAWTVAITGNITGNLSGSVGSVTNPVTLTSAYDAAKTAAQPSDVTAAVSAVETYGQSHWVTATGFATPTNVSDGTSAVEAYGDLHWTTAVGFATPTNVSNSTTAVNVHTDAVGSAIIVHGDSAWDTAVGFAVPGDQMTVDMDQPFTPTNNDETLGGALAAARAQGFGKWALVGTTLTLYAADGTTPVKAFTLDSATAPTSRT